MSIRRTSCKCLLALCLIGQSAEASAQSARRLLDDSVLTALASELSGERALRTVQTLTLHHRMRGSKAFLAASRAIEQRAAAAGLATERLEFPADGQHFYGTQKSRPAWEASFAELWELEPTASGWRRAVRIASWGDRPVTLAQDSSSGEVTAGLVDVGAGTSEADYTGLDVAGKLVLTSSQPGGVWPLAVSRFGASGIVSYAQNQVTAWWKEDETLVRWGHMETFPEPPTFAFMISLQQARRWQKRLAAGSSVRLQAKVEAGQRPGSYSILTAVIPGRNSAHRNEEIVFSCHLDHQRPGANDNASGCATILEVARTLQTLIDAGRIPPPDRTLRFVWPPEIEGTMALLNGRPDIAARIKAVIHMDMVGGSARTKAIFHITRGPASLPSFVNDVAEAFGRLAIAESARFASTASSDYPLVSPYGSKDALLAEIADFSMGSDHQVYTEGSFRIPAIYLNDWPDRYIHTNADSIDKIDPTKLLRAAFVGAASGYFLSTVSSQHQEVLESLLLQHALERTARAWDRAGQVLDENKDEAANVLRFNRDQLSAVFESLGAFFPQSDEAKGRQDRMLKGVLYPVAETPPLLRRDRGPVYIRKTEPKGPLSTFGYSYLNDQLDRHQLSRPALLSHRGRWGGGSEYAYEALNLVDGRREVGDIRDDLSAIYGPVSMELVSEFLETLERIGILEKMTPE